MTLRLQLPSPADTDALGAALARALPSQPVVAYLRGDLGAGKSHLARAMLRALGVRGAIKSPTYTLMEPYRASAARGGFEIAHCDFYRFDDPGEWEDAGFRDVFAAPGLKIVEWPEKAAGLLPRCDLRVSIAPSDRGDARSARFEALSDTGRELLP